MRCVTSFQGLGECHTAVQWGQQGTVGTLAVWLDEATLSLCHGELVKPAQSEAPWGTLKHTILPSFSKMHHLVNAQISPDLSKIFMTCMLDKGARASPQTVCSVFDTCTGDKLWEQALDNSEDGMLFCACQVWHPDNCTFFFKVCKRDCFSKPAGVYAVGLGDGSVRQCDFGWRSKEALSSSIPFQVSNLCISPTGDCLALSLCYEDSAPERVILHWPTLHLLWRVSNVAMGDLWWDWAGGSFAYFQMHPSTYSGISVCVAKPAAALDSRSGSAHAWASHASCHFNSPGDHEHPDANLMTRHIAWAPKGDVLALSIEHTRSYSSLHPPAGNAVLLLDAVQPDLPVLAQLSFEGVFTVDCLRWTPSSVRLCAIGRFWQADNAVHCSREKQAYVFSFADAD